MYGGKNMPENLKIAQSNFCIKMTAEIVSSYVGNHTIAPDDIPDFINKIYRAISDRSIADNSRSELTQAPAIDIGDSISQEFLICLEDGKQFKSLKRHLMTHYNMTPEEYREKWGLPHDYPMVAPAYAKTRSELAKQMGLGQKR
jgi:predicted transcriptional regulator